MIHARNFRCGSRVQQWAAAALVSGAGLLTLPGCDHSSNPPAAAPASQSATQVVTLRGVIKELPSAGAPHELKIHNEAAKDMGEMTMPFTADPSLPLTDLAVGDKISFDWNEDGDRITQMKKLPADTVLSFEKPKTKPATQP